MLIVKILVCGIMIFLVVIFFKFKIFINIFWCCLGIMVLVLKIMVFNFFWFNELLFLFVGLIFSKVRMLFVILLIVVIKGYSKVSSGSRIMEFGNVIFFGYSVVSVFGVIFVKISRISVKLKVVVNSF